MSEPSNHMTEEDLEKTLGELGEDEIAEIRKGLGGIEVDSNLDAEMHSLLQDVAGEAGGGEVPAIPASAKAMFEEQKDIAMAAVAKEEEELESTIYTQPRRYSAETPRPGIFSRLRLPIGLGIAGAAAALAVAMLWNGNESATSLPVAVADTVSVLTPGEVTGFTEPVLTWKAANGGVVDVEVVEAASGTTVATLENAFSPVRWSSLSTAGSLQPGKSYEIRLSAAGNELASRSFSPTASAEKAPEPASDLDGIIAQCEALIADKRPADAWMLWAELNPEQKGDPRMQKLKEEILSKIASA